MVSDAKMATTIKIRMVVLFRPEKLKKIQLRQKTYRGIHMYLFLTAGMIKSRIALLQPVLTQCIRDVSQ
jgi:hypothetical protein